MGAKRLEDLVAFQFAVEFKLEVYRIVGNSSAAGHDFKYKDQLFDAASGVERAIAEGFGRYRPLEFAQFLRYALASLGEAQRTLKDGIDRRHFSVENCAAAFTWARRCKAATQGLHASQLRLAGKPSSRDRRSRPASKETRARAGANRRSVDK